MSNDDNRNPYPEDKIINTESTSNNQNMNNNNQPFNMDEFIFKILSLY